MPFKALCQSEPVISLDFHEQAWREEKARQRAGAVAYACPGCGAPMALATSVRGTPFFKHYPNTDCPNSRPVSAEHARLQVAVYRRCTGLGWVTDIESRGPGGAWMADVLATSGDEQFAFEIQLAPITGEALAERSARYRAAGIVPVWLLRAFPARCPFPVPSRTVATAWARQEDPALPDHLDPMTITDEGIEQHFLVVETGSWSLDPALVYWRELGAVLAVFDAGGTQRERMTLSGRPLALDRLVGQVLAGEVATGLTALITAEYSRFYELVKRGERAGQGRERLVREVRRELSEREWDRLCNRVVRDTQR